MDSYPGHNYYFYSSASFTYYGQNDHPSTTVSVPIHSSNGTPTPIPVRLPPSVTAPAAVRIQAAYRGHLVRALVRRIRAVDDEAVRMASRIQRQETVDAVRTDERERLRMSEGLMGLLLRLDSVPGFYPAVRELRRAVSRRIVALEEVLNSILAAPPVAALEGIPSSWDDVVEGIWGGEEEEEEEEEEEAGVSERFNCLGGLLLGV